jgi:membrane-associated phospholipid phosphatase
MTLDWAIEGYLGFITTITSPISYIFIVIALYFLLRRKREALDLLMVLVITLALNYLLKNLFQAPRPFVVDESLSNRFTEGAGGYSFPSGHSQLIGSFCTYYILRYRNRLSWCLGGLMMASVAYSRVYFHLHYLKDVVAGIMVGAGISFTYLKFKTLDFQIKR